MATVEARVSYLEGKIDSLATKADVAELRGELRGEIKALRSLIMAAISIVGLALAGLNVILQLVG